MDNYFRVTLSLKQILQLKHGDMLQNPKLMITKSDQVQLASYLPIFLYDWRSLLSAYIPNPPLGY